MKVANKDASYYVTNKENFKGSNTFGEWVNEDIYAVYSYGKHFPLFVYDKDLDTFYSNSDKYSPSTSKQQTQLHPNCKTVPQTTKELKMIINKYG